LGLKEVMKAIDSDEPTSSITMFKLGIFSFSPRQSIFEENAGSLLFLKPQENVSEYHLLQHRRKPAELLGWS
jgi:hypothetical protein